MSLEILTKVGKLLVDFKTFEKSLNPQQKQRLKELLCEIRDIVAKIIAGYDLQSETNERRK